MQAYAVDAAGNAINSCPGALADTCSRRPSVTLPADPVTTGQPSTCQAYEIGRDGKVTCTFDDGSKSRSIAQIAIADFDEPDGPGQGRRDQLRARPPTPAPSQIGVSGEGTRGTMTAGALEMSNVDLAAEFTNLILAQRGFQASSRVITTSDQVLEELVNIKR